MDLLKLVEWTGSQMYNFNTISEFLGSGVPSQREEEEEGEAALGGPMKGFHEEEKKEYKQEGMKVISE